MSDEPDTRAAKTVAFVERLVARFPALAEDYECHVANCGGTLAYVFTSMELMDAVVGAYLGDEEYRDLDWAGVLDYLDEEYATAGPEARSVLVTSFVLDLPFRHEPGYGLVGHLGPQLAQAFAKHRPLG
jgi:hypothetical protein